MGRARWLRARLLPAGPVLLVVLASACATKPPPPPPPPPPVVVVPARPPVRLVWLPLDALVYPRLGPAINGSFETARLPGIDSQGQSPVSMEVAQLSLECSSPTDDCYAAVGRQLKADRLMWAEVKRDKRKKSVTLAFKLFDVQQSAMVGRAERSFSSEKLALDGFVALLGELTSPARAAAPAVGVSRTGPP